MRAALDGLRDAVREQTPDLLPGFKGWVFPLDVYTTKARAAGDVVAHLIGSSEPLWIADTPDAKPSEADRAAWHALMMRLSPKLEEPKQ